MVFKFLANDEYAKLTPAERIAYSNALIEHDRKYPLVQSITKYMQIRNPKTGETIPYTYRIRVYADGATTDNHSFRHDGVVNAHIRAEMNQEAKIHPADLGDGEKHSILTASIPKELEQEYFDRCDAMFEAFSIDEPTGEPDLIKNYTPKKDGWLH